MRVLKGPEFEKFFNEHIKLSEYRYKFLRKDVELIQNGTFNLYSHTFIVEDRNGWVVIIHSEDISLYGNNWTNNHIQTIKEHLELDKFTNYQLKGDRDLISAMIECFRITSTSVYKERFFYRCKKIIDVPLKDVSIRIANFDDSSKLAPMLQMYYHEEYHGENDKELSEMLKRINISIANQSIFVLENKQGLISFCTINNPDIGIIFTRQDYRKKGYGKMLLSYCSKLLLRKAKEIYLMTDIAEVSSNATAVSVGFERYYEFSYIWINLTSSESSQT